MNLIYFGYTRCPDACPMALGFAAKAWQALSPNEQNKTQILFVSVDHENDTPSSVDIYAKQFSSAMTGLTGSKSELESVVKQFKVAYEKERDPRTQLGYVIGHTDKIFFVSASGKVLEELASPRSYQVVLEAIRRNL